MYVNFQAEKTEKEWKNNKQGTHLSILIIFLLQLPEIPIRPQPERRSFNGADGPQSRDIRLNSFPPWRSCVWFNCLIRVCSWGVFAIQSRLNPAFVLGPKIEWIEQRPTEGWGESSPTTYVNRIQWKRVGCFQLNRIERARWGGKNMGPSSACRWTARPAFLLPDLRSAKAASSLGPPRLKSASFGQFNYPDLRHWPTLQDWKAWIFFRFTFILHLQEGLLYD